VNFATVFPHNLAFAFAVLLSVPRGGGGGLFFCSKLSRPQSFGPPQLYGTTGRQASPVPVRLTHLEANHQRPRTPS